MFIYMFVRSMCVCTYNFVACKVCYHVLGLVVTFPIPHDRGCEIKIIVIAFSATLSLSLRLFPELNVNHSVNAEQSAEPEAPSHLFTTSESTKILLKTKKCSEKS